jgi:hypothetical protein
MSNDKQHNIPVETSSQLERDSAWAKQAVGNLLAGCQLNTTIVASGLWPKLLCEMKHEVELSAYTSFVLSLYDARSLALDIEAAYLEHEQPHSKQA